MRSITHTSTARRDRAFVLTGCLAAAACGRIGYETIGADPAGPKTGGSDPSNSAGMSTDAARGASDASAGPFDASLPPAADGASADAGPDANLGTAIVNGLPLSGPDARPPSSGTLSTDARPALDAGVEQGSGSSSPQSSEPSGTTHASDSGVADSNLESTTGPGLAMDSGSAMTDSASSTGSTMTDSPSSTGSTTTDSASSTGSTTDSASSTGATTDSASSTGSTTTDSASSTGSTTTDTSSGTMACLVTNGGAELCDGIDNNCDGTVDEAGCPNNCSGIAYESSGYQTCLTNMNFASALTACDQQGMHLATVTTIGESDFLSGVMYPPDGSQDSFWFWLGARSDGSSTWSWLDGTPFSFSNWYAGATPTSKNQCLNVDDTGSWRSSPCNQSRRFVCEREY